MRAQPTPKQLQEAYLASRLPISLDDAMANPTVALALTNTALALAAQRVRLRFISQNDYKRRAAGDDD